MKRLIDSLSRFLTSKPSLVSGRLSLPGSSPKSMKSLREVPPPNFSLTLVLGSPSKVRLRYSSRAALSVRQTKLR